MRKKLLRKGLLGILIVLVSYSNVYALSPGDLPVSGGEIVISSNDELVIGEGEVVELNGTVRVNGSNTFQPQLTIENNGQFDIADGMFQAEEALIIIKNNATGTISVHNLALVSTDNGAEIRVLNRGTFQVTGQFDSDADGGTVSFENSGSASIHDWNLNAASSGRIHLCTTDNQLTIDDLNLYGSGDESSYVLSLAGDVHIGNFAASVAGATCGMCFRSGSSYVENIAATASGFGTFALKVQDGAEVTFGNTSFQAYGAEINLVNDGSLALSNIFCKSQMESSAGIVLLNRSDMFMNNVNFVANGAEGQLGLINENELTINNISFDSNYGGLNYICNRSGNMGIGNLTADVSGSSHGQSSRMVLYNNDIFSPDTVFHIVIRNTTGPDTVFDSFSVDQGVAYTFQAESGLLLNQDNALCSGASPIDGCALCQELWDTPCMQERANPSISIPTLNDFGVLALFLIMLSVGGWVLWKRRVDLN